MPPHQRKALFLDRDGVINVDHGYVYKRGDFEFMPGIFDLCRAARAKNYLLIVATNQSGIGRGLFSEAQFQSLSRWMQRRFEKEGAPLTALLYCPHHPTHGIGQYRIACACRKPKPGMLLEAKKAFGLNMRASILIGDKARDIEAGREAGVGKAILLGESGDDAARADRVVISLIETIDFI